MKPTQSNRDDPIGGRLHQHPAFGQIAAHRVSGGSRTLYGSDLKGQSFISITVSGSRLTRSLSNDWFHPTDTKVQVEMTEAQWASFVSSLNVGSGSPCTITRIGPETIPPIDWPYSRADDFRAELDDTMAGALSRLNDLEAAINEGKGSKKSKDELSRMVDAVRNGLAGNCDFVREQFSEHMEKTVEAAKAEINGYATALAFQSGAPKIESKETTK